MPNNLIQFTAPIKKVGPPSGWVDPVSPIGIKWASLGGQSQVGMPLTNATQLDDGVGQLQIFEFGAIFWSPGFGAVFVSEQVFGKWSSASVEFGTTVTGERIRSFLRYPTEDTSRVDSVAGPRQWSYFEGGMIYAGPEGTFVVYSAIYKHYYQLGGPSGFLGAPLSDEMPLAGNGRVSHFVNGDIYWHERSGAHELHGAIRIRWLALGGPSSPLGYPTSDEEPIFAQNSHPAQEVGRFNRFQEGSGIYWTLKTGAWEVYGDIWDKWQKSLGPTGSLGFPTSGETDTPASGGRYNEFERGVIVWHAGGPFVGTYAVSDLKLDLAEYNVNEDFNVQIHITATPNVVNHGRMPAQGEYDGGSAVFYPVVTLIDVNLVRANTIITVWLNAIHEVLIGKDDRMGTITASYSIDNVWGLVGEDPKHHNNAFDAWFKVKPKTEEETTDPDKLFWPFRNTSTFKLSWETFARTFRDVKETDKHINLNPFDLKIHPWEIFLYETGYNSLAQGGSCFGTCLEAIYARDKRSLFSEPLLDNSFNPYQTRNGDSLQPNSSAGDRFTLDEINVKHGYQWGGGFIEWFFGKWTAGALHDPIRAYWDSFFEFQSGNWPVLTISDEDMFAQDKSHVVLPFDWSHKDPNHPDLSQVWTISVKNPNFPQALHDDAHCKIEVDPRTETFSFLFKKGDTWRGSALKGGRLLCIPFAELNSRPVTPGYGIGLLIAAAIIIVMAGDGETEQITDGLGRTFFRSQSGHVHQVHHATGILREVNWDATTRIPDLIEIPTFGARTDAKTESNSEELLPQSQTIPPKLYYWRAQRPIAVGLSGPVAHTAETTSLGRGGLGISANSAMTGMTQARACSLQCQIRGTRDGMFRFTAIAGCMSFTVTTTAENGVVDSIHLGDAGGHLQHVVVAFPNATKPRDVSLAVAGWRGHDRQHARTFSLEKLSMDKTQSIRAHVTDGGKELVIENLGPATTFDLKLLVGLAATPVSLRSNLRLDATTVTRICPTDWSANPSPTAPIRLELLDRIGGKVLQVKNI